MDMRFRGFSIVDKKWVFGSLISKDDDRFILTDTKKAELHAVDRESVGIKLACTTPELYTGDIVYNPYWGTKRETMWELKWEETYGGGFIARNNTLQDYRENLGNLNRSTLIGNIFENGDILGKKKKVKE